MTENSALKLRAWNDLYDGNKIFRHGYSLGILIDKSNEKQGWVFYPRIGMIYDENSVQGGGVALNSMYKYKFSKNFGGYLGGGILFGWRDVIKEDIPQYGYAIMGSLGANYRFFKNIALNLELTPIYQINRYSKTEHFIISPHIGFSFDF